MNKAYGWLSALMHQVRNISDNIWHMECACKGDSVDDKSFECIRQAKLKLLDAERLLEDARSFQIEADRNRAEQKQ